MLTFADSRQLSPGMGTGGTVLEDPPNLLKNLKIISERMGEKNFFRLLTNKCLLSSAQE